LCPASQVDGNDVICWLFYDRVQAGDRSGAGKAKGPSLIECVRGEALFGLGDHTTAYDLPSRYRFGRTNERSLEARACRGDAALFCIRGGSCGTSAVK